MLTNAKETDFEHKQGNCLNRLDWLKFDLCEESKLGAETDVPKAVRRVSEIFIQPTFMKSVDGGDVKQGCLDDCWVLAAFTALANIDGGLRRVCVAYDTGKLSPPSLLSLSSFSLLLTVHLSHRYLWLRLLPRR